MARRRRRLPSDGEWVPSDEECVVPSDKPQRSMPRRVASSTALALLSAKASISRKNVGSSAGQSTTSGTTPELNANASAAQIAPVPLGSINGSSARGKSSLAVKSGGARSKPQPSKAKVLKKPKKNGDVPALTSTPAPSSAATTSAVAGANINSTSTSSLQAIMARLEALKKNGNVPVTTSTPASSSTATTSTAAGANINSASIPSIQAIMARIEALEKNLAKAKTTMSAVPSSSSSVPASSGAGASTSSSYNGNFSWTVPSTYSSVAAAGPSTNAVNQANPLSVNMSYLPNVLPMGPLYGYNSTPTNPLSWPAVPANASTSSPIPRIDDVPKTGNDSALLIRYTMKHVYEMPAHLNAEAETCTVCTSDFETGELVRRLPCFHMFHTDCVDDWLNKNFTCPLCRVDIHSSDIDVASFLLNTTTL